MEENRYSEKFGFPPLKEKYRNQIYSEDSVLSTGSSQNRYKRPDWGHRKPRQLKLIIDGLGELVFKTVRDAAEILGISRGRLYTYMRLKGKTPLPFVRFEYIPS